MLETRRLPARSAESGNSGRLPGFDGSTEQGRHQIRKSQDGEGSNKSGIRQAGNLRQDENQAGLQMFYKRQFLMLGIG